MKLRKQLAALLAAGALGFAVIGTAVAAGGNGGCDTVIRAGVQAGDCGDESESPSFEESAEAETEAPSEPVITEAPSFEQSESPETDAPSEPVITEPPVTDPPVTDPPVTDPPVTDPPVTDPPVTDPPVSPSFSESEGGLTDAPSEPDTAAIGGSDQTGSPADGAWLLVLALGMLLASIVVLTPARANRRR